MSEPLKIAQDFTAKWEGGYSNHPDDPGGATNYGISTPFLESFAKKWPERIRELGLNPESVVVTMLSPEQARKIMEWEFWRDSKIYQLPPMLAIVTYDYAVNSGASLAVRHLQTAYNRLQTVSVPLVNDGKIGPKTVGALHALDRSSVRQVAGEAINLRENHLRGLPTFEVFGKGWINRTTDLRRLIGSVDLSEPETNDPGQNEEAAGQKPWWVRVLLKIIEWFGGKK